MAPLDNSTRQSYKDGPRRLFVFGGGEKRIGLNDMIRGEITIMFFTHVVNQNRKPNIEKGKAWP
jgi:hypothetical protein